MKPGSFCILLLHTNKECAKDLSEEDHSILPFKKWFRGLSAKVPSISLLQE